MNNHTNQQDSSANIGFINETVECANDTYNAHLVKTGVAKSISDAANMPRNIICNCTKCKMLKS